MGSLVIEANNSKYLEIDDAASYAAVHDAASADSVQDIGIVIGQQYAAPPFEDWYLYRGTLQFALTGVSPNSALTAATISLYGQTDGSDTDFDITVVDGSDLGATIVVADYGELLNEITSYGALTTAGLAVEGWNVITLNAVGIAVIWDALSAGVVRFGLRSSRDISDTTPKLNGADANEYAIFYGIETAGKKPKLTLTFTSGEGKSTISVVGEQFHWVGGSGQEYFVSGTPVV